MAYLFSPECRSLIPVLLHDESRAATYIPNVLASAITLAGTTYCCSSPKVPPDLSCRTSLLGHLSPNPKLSGKPPCLVVDATLNPFCDFCEFTGVWVGRELHLYHSLKPPPRLCFPWDGTLPAPPCIQACSFLAHFVPPLRVETVARDL